MTAPGPSEHLQVSRRSSPLVCARVQFLAVHVTMERYAGPAEQYRRKESLRQTLATVNDVRTRTRDTMRRRARNARRMHQDRRANRGCPTSKNRERAWRWQGSGRSNAVAPSALPGDDVDIDIRETAIQLPQPTAAAARLGRKHLREEQNRHRAVWTRYGRGEAIRASAPWRAPARRRARIRRHASPRPRSRVVSSARTGNRSGGIAPGPPVVTGASIPSERLTARSIGGNVLSVHLAGRVERLGLEHPLGQRPDLRRSTELADGSGAAWWPHAASRRPCGSPREVIVRHRCRRCPERAREILVKIGPTHLVAVADQATARP